MSSFRSCENVGLSNNDTLFTDPLGRRFEELLNEAWSTLAAPGEWLSFDEHAVKTEARATHSLSRFSKSEPVKQGETGCERVAC